MQESSHVLLDLHAFKNYWWKKAVALNTKLMTDSQYKKIKKKKN